MFLKRWARMSFFKLCCDGTIWFLNKRWLSEWSHWFSWNSQAGKHHVHGDCSQFVVMWTSWCFLYGNRPWLKVVFLWNARYFFGWLASISWWSRSIYVYHDERIYTKAVAPQFEWASFHFTFLMWWHGRFCWKRLMLRRKAYVITFAR